MDPNFKNFPILSYVMSRFFSTSPPSFSEHDIEASAPPEAGPASSPRLFERELVERMPQLRHPDFLASLAHAVNDVAETRAVLQALGVRPDHEAVDAARARIADIDGALILQLEELVRQPRPDNIDISAWRAELSDREIECRVRADAEKSPYTTVVKLDEMHVAYEDLLKEAEERLEKLYDSSADGDTPAIRGEVAEDEQMNEEVVSILQQASVKCIERVELSGRQLRLFPEAFGKLHGLTSLILSNNSLEAIPDAIAGLKQLQELNLSSNLLLSLPDSIGLLLSLKLLDVSNNKLKSLPDTISQCRALVELNASYNELTYLPTNIGYELVNLQKLWIYLNKLRSLPQSICKMSSLRVLDAHFNELRGLPYSIGNLINLETLNLSSNFSDLKELPPTLGDLVNLRELDLSNNQIHALPDSFGRLENLTKLNLAQNPLVVPPMEVVNQGAESVKMYMAKRLLDMLTEQEERRQQVVETPQSEIGWLSRSTSWLSKFAAGVSGGVGEYLSSGDNAYRDPCLDQQL